MRRRGKAPKTHFVTSPAPLIEEVEEQLKNAEVVEPELETATDETSK